MSCAITHRTIPVNIIVRVTTVVVERDANSIKVKAEILNALDECIFVDYVDGWIGGCGQRPIAGVISKVKRLPHWESIRWRVLAFRNDEA